MVDRLPVALARRLVQLLLTAAVAAAMVLSANGTAHAANPYNFHDVCGSGYKVLSGGVILVKSRSGTSYGVMYVGYNSSNGRNCVTTIKTRYVNVPSIVDLLVQVAGDPPRGNADMVRYYAGPIYVYAPGRCLSVSTTMYTPDGDFIARGNGSGWCG